MEAIHQPFISTDDHQPHEGNLKAATIEHSPEIRDYVTVHVLYHPTNSSHPCSCSKIHEPNPDVQNQRSKTPQSPPICLQSVQYLLMDDQLTFGNLLTQSSSLADLDFSQKSYLSIYSHATLSHMVLPNDAKVLKYKTFCEVVNNEKVLKLVINTLDNPSSEPKSSTLKEIDEPPKICISETVDNTNSVGRIQPKFFRTSDGVAKNRTCQRILSQPDLHSSLESRSRATPNNNRYNLRETSEDDIINKFSEDEGDSLKQTPTERQEQGLDQILENDTLFSKKRDRNLKRDNNTIDYFNTGTQNEIEEKLKTRSYNGTHKRHETVNFGTEANFLTEDGFENHLAHSRRLIPKKSKVKKNSSTIGLNKNILKAKLITTSSFENFNDPVKL